MLIAALMTAVLLPVEAPADPDGGQDSVVATAPATSVALDATAGPVAPPVGRADPASPQMLPQSGGAHGLNTDQQIAQWLAARSPEPDAREGLAGWRDDRKPHGEISVGVGTGGYRDYAGWVSMPIGEKGRLDLSVRQVENGYPYGYGYGAGYGYDPYLDDGGYPVSGHEAGARFEYGHRFSRSEGPPRRLPAVRPLQADQE